MGESDQIDTFTRFTRVSRETITSLKKYEEMLIKANESLNLIGKSTIPQLWIRHYLENALSIFDLLLIFLLNLDFYWLLLVHLRISLNL